jgi:hypothetical protein
MSGMVRLSHDSKTRLVPWLAAVSFLAACGDDVGEPSGSGASKPAGFSSGTAHVVVTRDLEATLELDLAQDSESSFRDGRVSLAWEDPEGNFMSVSATPKNGEADARSDETPLVANFVVTGKSFSSEHTRTCSASFDRLSSQAVSGTLTCNKLRLPVGEAFRAVDVEATFSAEGA